MKAMRIVFTSNWVPYLQMRSVGSHRTAGREKEGKTERTGLVRLLPAVHGATGEENIRLKLSKCINILYL